MGMIFRCQHCKINPRVSYLTPLSLNLGKAINYYYIFKKKRKIRLQISMSRKSFLNTNNSNNIMVFSQRFHKNIYSTYYKSHELTKVKH